MKRTDAQPRAPFEPDWDADDPDHWRNPPRIVGNDPKDPRDKCALLTQATRQIERLEAAWRAPQRSEAS